MFLSTYPSIDLSVCQCAYLPIHLSIYLSFYFSNYLPRFSYLSVNLTIFSMFYLSIVSSGPASPWPAQRLTWQTAMRTTALESRAVASWQWNIPMTDPVVWYILYANMWGILMVNGKPYMAYIHTWILWDWLSLLVGGLVAINLAYFPMNIGLLSSSQLTHIFQRGFSPTTNQIDYPLFF